MRIVVPWEPGSKPTQKDKKCTENERWLKRTQTPNDRDKPTRTTLLLPLFWISTFLEINNWAFKKR